MPACVSAPGAAAPTPRAEMFKRLLLHVLLAVAALGVAPAALASGGRYVFDGGSRAERAQVNAALGASALPWDVVPGLVVVHISAGVPARALPDQILLD